MKSYLLQERNNLGKWKTIRKESADEMGAIRAEAWLRNTLTGSTQRRIKMGDWTLTQEEALEP